MFPTLSCRDLRCLAPTKRKCLPYGTHRYWKLDGVSPETRAKVKKAAKLAGENVGSWVERALREKLKAPAPTLIGFSPI